MRGISYLLVLAGVAAAQSNLTVQTSQIPPSPSAATDATTEEPLFSIAGYGYPTCQPTTKWVTLKPVTITITSKVPGPKETKTITSTCYETTTKHDTTTLTSTTTCTEVSLLFLSVHRNMSRPSRATGIATYTRYRSLFELLESFEYGTGTSSLGKSDIRPCSQDRQC